MKQFITDITRGPYSLMQGLWVTWKNLLRPAVTLQYPKQRQKMSDRYRGMAQLASDKCIVCMQCIKVCPAACLSLTSKVREETKKKALETFRYDAQLCCFCGFCEEVCPTKAIFLNKDYEVAVIDDRSVLHVDLMKGYQDVAWYWHVD